MMKCNGYDVFIPTRYQIGALICLACTVYSMLRSSMSIIILAMTENPYDSSVELPDYGIRYPWTTYDQSLVIGSYFWGSTLICSLAGVFAERYGARYLLGIAFALAAILSTVLPVASQFLWLLIVVRFLSGILMGTVFPSIYALISTWSLPEERGKFLSLLTLSGLGSVIDWSISGHIIETYGWKYAFYVVAVIFGIFAVIWFTFVYDSPRKHPWITAEERDFIESKLDTSGAKKKHWPPFRSIFLSVPFWALLFFHFGHMSGYNFLFTSIPRYLSEVHSFGITSTGLLASVPYLVRIPCAIMFGFIGDLLAKRKPMSTNAIRKIFSICSHFIPGCCLIIVTFVGDQPYTSLAFISIGLCFNSAVVITSIQNAYDIAPTFASSIYGIITMVGSLSGYLSPLLVAYFTREGSTEKEWRNIFFVGAGIYIGTAVIFVIFGSGQIQKWNDNQVKACEHQMESKTDKNRVVELTAEKVNAAEH